MCVWRGRYNTYKLEEGIMWTSSFCEGQKICSKWVLDIKIITSNWFLFLKNFSFSNVPDIILEGVDILEIPKKITDNYISFKISI